jgi:hypothetical protein
MDWNPEDQLPSRGMYGDLDLSRERNRDERLENLRNDLFGREERRKRLAREVIDQRLTLRQAAALIREMESVGVSAAYYAYTIQDIYPGKTMEESLCRKVISLVNEELKEEPERYARVHARLEAELEKEPEPSRSLPSPTAQTPASAHE